MNDDLISRQAAIDALDGTVTVTGRTNAEAVRGYVNLVQDRIKRLPSAGQIMTATSNTVVSDTVQIPVMDGTTERLPSAQPEISRIEQELHGKTPEEQYEFLYWLLLKFGLAYTDSRLAVIEWLRGEKEE